MAVDASHPNCFLWNGQLFVSPLPSAEAEGAAAAYDAWGRGLQAQVPWDVSDPILPLDIAILAAGPVVGVAVAVAFDVTHGVSVFLAIGHVLIGLVAGAALGIFARAIVSIPDTRARKKATEERADRAAQVIADLGPRVYPQDAIWLPPRVAAVAAAETSAADLVRIARVIGVHENELASVEPYRQSVTSNAWTRPRDFRDFQPDPQDLDNLIRSIRSGRAEYESAAAEIGLEPLPMPSPSWTDPSAEN